MIQCYISNVTNKDPSTYTVSVILSLINITQANYVPSTKYQATVLLQDSCSSASLSSSTTICLYLLQHHDHKSIKSTHKPLNPTLLGHWTTIQVLKYTRCDKVSVTVVLIS